MTRRAIVFDVDGTLADATPFRRADGSFDHVNSPSGMDANDHVVALTRAVHPDVAVLVVTARRRNRAEVPTLWFLLLNDVRFDGLFMRDTWDNRPDAEVKADILADIRSQGFDVVHAVDDNPSVIPMWEAAGIPVTVVPGFA